MRPNPQPNALPQVAFIMDERLSRERNQLLQRLVRSMRTFAQVEVMEGDISEERVLEKLKTEKYKLILAPWYRYMEWKRVEGALGMTRVGGTHFAGYFADQLLPHELSEGISFSRALLFDFCRLHPGESLQLVSSLIKGGPTSGIRNFLKSETPIYGEDWFTSQGLGLRADLIYGLSSTAGHDWRLRSNALRICLLALWSMVYDEGPGKENALQGNTRADKKAQFEFGSDDRCFALRLLYHLPGSTIKGALTEYWPDPHHATTPAQILLRYADAVRVHTVAETSAVEITALFYPSAPSAKTSNEVRTLWIEPITPKMLTDGITPHLTMIPPFSAFDSQKVAEEEAHRKHRERLLAEAHAKIRDLTGELIERDRALKELKAGGLGRSVSPPPPDGESLLAAFHDRYRECRQQIRTLEQRIELADGGKLSLPEIERLNEKLVRLYDKEDRWIDQLKEAIEAFKKERLQAG